MTLSTNCGSLEYAADFVTRPSGPQNVLIRAMEFMIAGQQSPAHCGGDARCRCRGTITDCDRLVGRHSAGSPDSGVVIRSRARGTRAAPNCSFWRGEALAI